MLAWYTLHWVGSIFSPRRPSSSFMLLIINLFIRHGLVWKFYFILASLRSSLTALTKGQRLRSFFNFDIMIIIFSLILTAFGPSFSSFHQSIHGSFKFDGRWLFELLCFFHDSFFIFGALRSSPSSVFLIAIDGRFLIILSDGPLILPGGIIILAMALTVLLSVALVV